MIEITFLGTSCMVPTKERNVQGIFLEFKGEGILFDCGEGTQRQMNIAGINRNKVKKILITHWHGDHVSGLIGLIQTMGNNDNPGTLEVYGPKGSKERMQHLLKTVVFDQRIKLEVKELEPKGVERFFENQDYYLECAALKHSTPCLAYNFIEKDRFRINLAKASTLGLKAGPLMGRLQRGKTVTFKGKEIKPEEVTYLVKGKKITILLDTVMCDNCVKLARDADLLIAESAYASDLEEKALEYKHMTTKQVGYIATEANVKKLIITHFSQRYKTSEKLLDDIRTFFPNSECAFDFMKVKL
jgi:ribonuclease Z